jgi:hypothetical protein
MSRKISPLSPRGTKKHLLIISGKNFRRGKRKRGKMLTKKEKIK